MGFYNRNFRNSLGLFSNIKKALDISGDGLIDLRIFTLPIEEFLFMFIVPYFALVIYKIYKK